MDRQFGADKNRMACTHRDCLSVLLNHRFAANAAAGLRRHEGREQQAPNDTDGERLSKASELLQGETDCDSEDYDRNPPR